MSEQAILKLIDLLYDSAVNASRWADFLAHYAEAANATHANLKIFDFRDQTFNVPAQFGYSPEFMKAHDEYWGARDVYFVHAKHLLHTGWVHQSQDYISDERLLKSDSYNEFLIHDDIFHQCGVIIEHNDTRNAILTTLRSKDSGPFDEEQLQLLRQLLPHLQRATEIHYRLVNLGKKNLQMEFAIDRFPTGIVFVDVKGKVLFANASARELFERKSGVWMENGQLTTSGLRQKQQLQKAIHGAAQTGTLRGTSAGEVFRINRPETDRPLAVTVTPFPERIGITPENTAAAVFITDPNRNGALPEAVLKSVYGLTPAETRLAGLLLEGHTLDEAAELLQVKRNTVISQLKGIFTKTNTRRQSELLRLLAVLNSQKFAI